MKAIKTAAAVLGGIAAVTLAVGLGGAGVGATGAAAAPETHSSFGTAPARTEAAVHPAILAGCVAGLDC